MELSKAQQKQFDRAVKVTVDRMLEDEVEKRVHALAKKTIIAYFKANNDRVREAIVKELDAAIPLIAKARVSGLTSLLKEYW